MLSWLGCLRRGGSVEVGGSAPGLLPRLSAMIGAALAVAGAVVNYRFPVASTPLLAAGVASSSLTAATSHDARSSLVYLVAATAQISAAIFAIITRDDEEEDATARRILAASQIPVLLMQTITSLTTCVDILRKKSTATTGSTSVVEPTIASTESASTCKLVMNVISLLLNGASLGASIYGAAAYKVTTLALALASATRADARAKLSAETIILARHRDQTVLAGVKQLQTYLSNKLTSSPADASLNAACLQFVTSQKRSNARALKKSLVEWLKGAAANEKTVGQALLNLMSMSYRRTASMSYIAAGVMSTAAIPGVPADLLLQLGQLLRSFADLMGMTLGNKTTTGIAALGSARASLALNGATTAEPGGARTPTMV